MAFATPLWLLSVYRGDICACVGIKISIWIESFRVPKIVTFRDLKTYFLFSKHESDLSALWPVWEISPRDSSTGYDFLCKSTLHCSSAGLSPFALRDHATKSQINHNNNKNWTVFIPLAHFPKTQTSGSRIFPLKNKWNLKHNLLCSREPSFYAPSITQQRSSKFIQPAIRETASKQNPCQDNIFLLIME